MKGVPREVAEHKLNIKPRSKPVKQRLRRFNDDKCKAIGEEIQKLLCAGFICEVFHPEWLANPVLVKKKNKKWRMCIDYTILNKACPKDPFPLPRIDQVVDSTAECETICFLDAYSGYHQIAMCVATNSQPRSLLHSAHAAIKRCPSGSKTRVLLSNDACDASSRELIVSVRNMVPTLTSR
jgi:hypothetical protein